MRPRGLRQLPLQGENLMKISVIAICFAAVALAACRREEPAPYYEPMKLGGDVHQTSGR
jgi:hypothetical protein